MAKKQRSTKAAVELDPASFIAGYPSDFPRDSMIAAVWAARSLVDMLKELKAATRRSTSLDRVLMVLNRDLKELLERLPTGYDQLASGLYPDTGVEIDGHHGTCYAELAFELGKTIYWRILFRARCDQMAAALRTVGTAEKFVPINPATAIEHWESESATELFDGVSDATLERLVIALVRERRKVDAAINGDSSPVKIAPKGTPGRKADPQKDRHAMRSNELRASTPQTSWKDCATVINSEFELTDDRAYTFKSIRELHRLKCGDKKRD